MPYPYITQAELEARIGASAVRRILDDNNDGTADAARVTRLLADASAKVAGSLRGKYILSAVETNTPEEVKRIALDIAHAYACKNHPEWVRGDWVEMLKMSDRELTAIRKGEMRLDVEGTPEPGQQVEGQVYTGLPATEEEPEKTFFLGGTDLF